MRTLFEEYELMLKKAGEFMKIHEISMSGRNLQEGVTGMVIPSNLLDDFEKELRKADKKFTKLEKESGSDDAAFYFPFGRD